MKHNVSKIHKAQEAITEIEAKKRRLMEENLDNERNLPNKEKELVELNAKKAKAEQEFEKHEEQVR
jgi:chromosome segregation ATPase